ncbi:MAG: LytTR family DNA-binding domain-containing protein [Bacteroidota bacterium]
MKIETIIVDDEPHARSRIARLLEEDTDVRLVGEVSCGREAANLINRKKPDVVFLDVEMPDFDGFEVISKIDKSNAPYVIITTAYDTYALKAFEIDAVDYLLKPYDRERFFKSLRKAKDHVKLRRTSVVNKQIMDMLLEEKQLQNEDNTLLYVKIWEKGREITIDISDVFMIEANGNYTKIHVEDRSFLYRCTMKEFEKQLDPNNFLRIHRSCILNVNYIVDIRYQNKDEYEFELINKYKVASGRSYVDHVRRFVNYEFKH